MASSVAKGKCHEEGYIVSDSIPKLSSEDDTVDAQSILDGILDLFKTLNLI